MPIPYSQRKINLRKPIEPKKEISCLDCEGTGRVSSEEALGEDNIIIPQKCTTCNGTGKLNIL